MAKWSALEHVGLRQMRLSYVLISRKSSSLSEVGRIVAFEAFIVRIGWQRLIGKNCGGLIDGSHVEKIGRRYKISSLIERRSL
jgi:hypothetical protein